MKMLVRSRQIACIILPLLILGISVSPVASQPQDLDGPTISTIDAFIASKMQELKIPGLALGIVHGDQIVYLRGYGVADGSGRRVTPQTPFHLASLTKSFTALAIMQLAEAGKIDLDAPVQKYIPWFRPGEAERPIKVRDLLYHTAGFSTYEGRVNLLHSDGSDSTLESDVNRLSAAKLDRPAGESFEYSNAGYEIAGYLVQTLSGQPYEAYIKERLLTPLEMPHSWLSEDEARADGMADEYYPFFGVPVVYNVRLSRSSVPEAGILSSAEDMTHYLIAHLNGGRYGAAAIVSPTAMARLHRPGVDIDHWNSYALGWYVWPLWPAHTQDQDDLGYRAPTALSHDGSGPGVRANMLLVPVDGWGVITLMNTNDPSIESAFGSVSYGVIALLMGLEPPPTSIGENSVVRNGRLMAVGLVLVQVLRFMSSIRATRRRRLHPEPRARALVRPVQHVLIPAFIDVAIATWILVGIPQIVQYSFPDTIRGAPDIGLLFIVTLALTLGWGATRTVLYLMALHQLAHPAVPTVLAGREVA